MKSKAKKKSVQKRVKGGELNVGRTLAQNAMDLSRGGLDVGPGFGGGGKAFAGMMQDAMKKTAQQLSGVESKASGAKKKSTGMAKPTGMAPAAKPMKKGGMVKKKIDGIASKGKTRGRIC